MTAALELVSYLPTPARIVAVQEESCDTRTFVLEPSAGAPAPWRAARPGQFVMLSLLGEGEAAFTISRLAEPDGVRLSLTVRRVGRLTAALFALHAGSRVGVRGPFGRGFPTWPVSADLLFVAGGCGLAPLRWAIEDRIAASSAHARTTIVYGARDPRTRIFRADVERWRGASGVAVLDCVEEPDSRWRGHVGNVDHEVEAALRAAAPAFAAVCGPAPMMAIVARRLVHAGLSPAHVSLAIERQMKCGFGICGRCYVGHRLACVDGPVFPLAELAPIDAAFHDAVSAA